MRLNLIFIKSTNGYIMVTNSIDNADFNGTLSKALVHKVSIDQVLLTNYRAVGGKNTLLFAQLPRSHGFYCEHMVDSKNHDLVAIIEICRQACFVVAHTQFGISLEGDGFQFLFQALDATLSEAGSLALSQKAGQPIQLVVQSTIEHEKKKKNGETYALDWLYILSTIDDEEVARVKIRQTLLERNAWRTIRKTMKRERNITPDMQIPPAPDTELNPSDVSRINPNNIVLHNVNQTSENHFEAMARIDTRHPVLFDRSTEHIYGMIQIEVGRQLALYAAANMLDVDAMDLEVWQCKTTFTTIGELEIPAKAEASVQINDHSKNKATVSLSIAQQDRKISEFTLEVRAINR